MKHTLRPPVFKIELNSSKWAHTWTDLLLQHIIFISNKKIVTKQTANKLFAWLSCMVSSFKVLHVFLFVILLFYLLLYSQDWGSVFVGFWPWLKNTTTFQQSKKWGLSWKYNVYDWKVDDATWICFVIVFSIGLLVNWLWFIVFLVNWLLAMLVFQFWVKFG